MFRRAHPIAITIFLMLAPVVSQAQVVWQPTAPPLVTAENTSWFRAGEPIEWNGDIYYPAGTPEFFNRYQMVRSGSYRGIPVYTDVMLVPNSIVFVPMAGERMQPYERPRTGPLAGTSGSRVSSLPSAIGAESTLPSGIQQAAMPPTVGTAYDGALPPPAESIVVLRPTDTESAIPAGSATVPTPRPSAVGTSGRIPAAAPIRTVSTVVPPTGLNGIWIGYDGQRWFAKGNAVDLNATTFRAIGSYYGWPVYQRLGDDSTIYVPTRAGRVAPYQRR
jgi:hypothetical protein